MDDEFASEQVTVLDQRSFIKIETIRGRTPTQIYDLLREVCGDSTIDRSTISRWSQRFCQGRVNIGDDQRPGRLRKSIDNTSMAIIASVLEEDRHVTCEEIARESGIPKSSVHRILTEVLEKIMVAAQWVPRQLSDDQRVQRMEIATQLFARFQQEGDVFLKRIVAIDEIWMRDFEPELKSQSAQWTHPSSPYPSKCRRQLSKAKQLVIMAYDYDGVIATDRVPIGVSVTGDYYAAFLHQKFRQNRSQLLDSGVLIIHDNARPHVMESVKTVLSDYKWEALLHPAYSPDMNPSNFDLFPKLKNLLRGQRFLTLDALSAAVTRRLQQLNSSGELNGIKQLVQHWEAVISCQGDYTEHC